MRKLANLFVLAPLAIILILLSVANRQSVTFSLDPTNMENPALSLTLPFFIFLFVAVFIGMFIGSMLTWVNQGKHRKALREKAYEANMLKRENEKAHQDEERENREIAPGLPAVRGPSKAA